MQRQAVRQDVGFCNRPDRRGQEASAEADHHERQYRMACDDAEQCRHQSILAVPSPARRSWHTHLVDGNRGQPEIRHTLRPLLDMSSFAA